MGKRRPQTAEKQRGTRLRAAHRRKYAHTSFCICAHVHIHRVGWGLGSCVGVCVWSVGFLTTPCSDSQTVYAKRQRRQLHSILTCTHINMEVKKKKKILPGDDLAVEAFGNPPLLVLDRIPLQKCLSCVFHRLSSPFLPPSLSIKTEDTGGLEDNVLSTFLLFFFIKRGEKRETKGDNNKKTNSLSCWRPLAEHL